MNVINAQLEAVGVKPAQFPASDVPEVAFAGRSNVGKSSLINCMMNRKSLARTSRTPGKTRTINFYSLDSKLRFVDLPGYGYAKVSRKESESWGRMIEGYLRKRQQLKCVILLVDVRHKPTADDKMLYDYLKAYDLNMMVVATKIDKINRSRLKEHLSVIHTTLEMEDGQQLVPFSSETKSGKDSLWALIEAAVQT